MPVPEAFGGRRAVAVTYARTLARIDREGTGVRTVFSARSSLGPVAPLARGSEAQQGRYLPASCRGEVLLAFAPTEPEAGSDLRALRMTYRRDGDRFFQLAGTRSMVSGGSV